MTLLSRHVVEPSADGPVARGGTEGQAGLVVENKHSTDVEYPPPPRVLCKYEHSPRRYPVGHAGTSNLGSFESLFSMTLSLSMWGC